MYNIWRAKDNLYTESEIKEMLKNTIGDSNQEYLCKFTIGEDSILGEVTSQDKHGKEEWIIEDEEDDNFIEREEEENDRREREDRRV